MTIAPRLASLLAASILLAGAASAADPAFPNLVGTWTWRSEGVLLVRGKSPGPAVHREPGVGIAEGEVVFTAQDGRVLQGTTRSKKAVEPLACAIGTDGRTFSCADTDGYWDGRIVDPDTVEYVYRHANERSSLVAVGVMKRKR